MMIDRTNPLPVGKQAKLLGISRGTVYCLPRATSEADLARQCVQVGRLHVRTLMRRMGICAMASQPGTSRPSPGHKIYPYLLHDVCVTQANHVWALDTTYIPMERGFVYLTAVLDVASRRVLAHKVATTLQACHAVEVISEALGKYSTPEIVNTDQGSQFTATEFTDVVLQAGCKLSMDGAWCLARQRGRGAAMAHHQVRACVQACLRQRGRPHSSLEDQTPDEACRASLPKPAKAA